MMILTTNFVMKRPVPTTKGIPVQISVELSHLLVDLDLECSPDKMTSHYMTPTFSDMT